MDMKLGFIGAGAMGSSMIKSLIKAGTLKGTHILIFDPDSMKCNKLHEEFGVEVINNSLDLVKKSDFIILAVKPNIIKSVLEECKEGFDQKKILISFAVGVPIQFYKNILGNDKKIVRTMPNTPMQVGEGMTMISLGENITQGEGALIKELFEATGKAEFLEERLMSEVTALTGSSPAYVYMFIEAMADAAVKSGIPRGLSYKLAAQAVIGSAKMVLETGIHPGELKDQVCSPAGTTIEAVNSLEKSGFRASVMEAMNECTKRAKEIGKIYE